MTKLPCKEERTARGQTGKDDDWKSNQICGHVCVHALRAHEWDETTRALSFRAHLVLLLIIWLLDAVRSVEILNVDGIGQALRIMGHIATYICVPVYT